MTLWKVLTFAVPSGIALLGIACAIHALMTRQRTSTSVIAWTMVCLGVPLLGALLYLTLGRHRLVRKRLAARRRAVKVFESRRGIRSQTHHHDDELPEGTLAGGVAKIIRDSPISRNEIRIFEMGDRAYEDLFRAMGEARDSICIHYYILEADSIGEMLAETLAAACKRGVSVRLLYDAVGCNRTSNRYWRALRDAGVDVHSFLPVRLFKWRWDVNLRNHRKLVVVDGDVAFTGSLNLSARHLAGETCESLDIQFRVRGPAAQEILSVFAQDWYFATKESLHEEPMFHEVEDRGHHRVQVIESGPDRKRHDYHEALVTAAHLSQQSIRLVTPYFVPDPTVRDALLFAVRRGVKVELIVPDKPDHKFMRLATDDHIQPLLEAGVRVFRRGGPMIHMKLGLFDECVALVGSTNLDQRSFFLNFEMDLAIYGLAFGRELGALMDAHLKESMEVNVFELTESSVFRRVGTRLASLLSPVL